MELRLSLEMDNAAFASTMGRGHEVARILRRLAGQVEADGLRHGDEGKLRDVNGNTVGRWEVVK